MIMASQARMWLALQHFVIFSMPQFYQPITVSLFIFLVFGVSVTVEEVLRIGTVL